MYRTVIFDMDGVITTEERYWDAAAYTTAEFCGLPYEEPAKMRAKFFCNDRVIPLLKNQGVNTNYELSYLAIAFYDEDSEKQYETMAAYPLEELYKMAPARIAKRLGIPAVEAVQEGAFWERLKNALHEWFLGSERFTEFYGKKAVGGRAGLCDAEMPLVGLAPLKAVLETLFQKGVRLAIGTGRPKPEAYMPLRAWGVLDLFSKDHIICLSHIQAAEAKFESVSLKKPHPYSFIKAYFGESFPDADIINGNYPKDFSDCLVVGDAGADLFAAKAQGADFAAVLTGSSGKAARPFFEENNATYIFDDITHITEIF